MRPVLAVILVLFIPAVGLAATINVPTDYGTIQAAINAAANGDTIIVRAGTYVENIDFTGKAITVESVSGASATFIDGGQAGSVVTFQSGEGTDSILDGFTVTNGYASYGGGIYCINSSPTLKNLVIDGNSASDSGGGIFARGGDLDITDSTFTDNSAISTGGGIYIDTGNLNVTNCDFDSNTVNPSNSNTKGGAIYFRYDNLTTVSISDTRFFGNQVGGYGGGLYLKDREAATLVNNLIYDNEANYGGGIYLEASSSSTITNNTISYNSATYPRGRGIYVEGNSSSKITNTIIWDDSSSSEPAFYLDSGTATVTYCDIKGGTGQLWFGTTCIENDPHFADSNNGDFHLISGSPCIDTGDNNAPSLPPYDIEGNDRKGDGDNDGDPVVDMGAYEYQYPTLVELISFTATGYDQRIAVAWETASEENCAGFHLWRSVSPDPTQGSFIRITDNLIPSRGGPSIGAEYSFIDGYVVPGRTYFYKLEVMDYGCVSTFYGPVSMKWWKPPTEHF